MYVSEISEATEGDGCLTDYVATRWYRAPEILLASKKYTAGVDMWSLGCILAEMLLGKPLFPGTSTINQIEKIVATIPLPQGREINEICSDYAQSILDKANTVAKRPLKEFLPDATSEAFSLVELLLKFNPSKRLTAHAGLRHPYVARFHNTAQVCLCPLSSISRVRPSLDLYQSNRMELSIKGQKPFPIHHL